MRETSPTPDVIDRCAKGFPRDAEGATWAEFLGDRPRLSRLSTPLLVLDGAAVQHNIDVMARYCAEHGMRLAPHGKTTMAPRIWRQQLAAGAWGITVANSSQIEVARTVGVPRIQLANALLDPEGLRQAQAMAGEGVEFVCWADSVATVRRMEAHLDAARAPLGVLVELGAPGGRTGARTLDAAIEVARAIHESPALQLRGVSGYEGALAHDRSDAGLRVVAAYLTDMAALHARLGELGLHDTDDVFVTAGGSAYFDLVARHVAPLASERTTVLLRAGAYVIHDDGFYRGISPLSSCRSGGEDADPAGTLRPAMHAWTRVVSRPEPGLALLDGGKRDLPYDEGLPTPQLTATELGRQTRPLAGATITAMNDQHSFLALPGDDPLSVGDVVRLGLSHPCTAMDKWRLVPVVDADGVDPVITDLVRTYF